MGNPEKDPISIIAKMRETQPGPVVKIPGELVDALLKKFELKTQEILVFADTAGIPDESVFGEDAPRAMSDLPRTPLPTFGDGIDEGLMNMMYEAGRGEAGKNGVKQMPTEKILAEVSEDGTRRRPTT